MSKKKIKVAARIGRYMNGDGTMYLELEDKASGAKFVKLEFGPEEFADLMTNRQANLEGYVAALDRVGKKYVSKPFDLVLPKGITAYDKKAIKKYLKEERSRIEEENDNWFLDIYVDSQTSVSTETDAMHGTKMVVAHLKLFTYVEEEND